MQLTEPPFELSIASEQRKDSVNSDGVQCGHHGGGGDKEKEGPQDIWISNHNSFYYLK